MSLLNRAVFAGTFNPFTLGHYDILCRASKIFDEVVIGVADDSSGRKELLSVDDRLDIAKLSVSEISNVIVKPFCGFLVDFARAERADIILRGLRSAADVEYEKSLSAVYKSQNDKIECVYLISEPAYSHISGTIVRQLVRFGGSLEGYVCRAAMNKIEHCYGK